MYQANENRYEQMPYQRCGNSGLKLSALALGLWQNFGQEGDISQMEQICRTAFDHGITYFDLANNYGYPYNGTAELNFGTILKKGLGQYRNELCIATKAGHNMWPGTYGTKNGCRKYLITSLEDSLKRMNLDYVDIFYHHVYDPETPLEETALALDQVVRQGKALYVGISNYNQEQTKKIAKIFKELKTPFIVNQPSYSILNRWIEDDGLKSYAAQNGIGLAVYSPLAQGLLSSRYLDGVPEDSRYYKANTGLKQKLTQDMKIRLIELNFLAQKREQTLAQMAIAWLLQDKAITSVIIGASRPEQVTENIKALENLQFTAQELKEIYILTTQKIG